MSGTLLERLREAHAFDSSPLDVDLPVYHVPFDDEHRSGTESAVLAAARSGERIGLQGPIGGGKSSVLRSVLDAHDGALAPVWVSVAFDEDAVVLDPRRFAAHIVQSVTRTAANAAGLSETERDAILRAVAARRPLPSTERKLAAKLGATFWVANAGMAREVREGLAGVDLTRPAAEILDVVRHAMEIVAGSGRQPVLVVDDSDSFTRRAGWSTSRDDLISGFFGPVLRSLTDIDAGVIVAVHDHYLELDGFAAARAEYGALEQLVAVPEIVSGHLGRILDRRIELVADTDARAVFTAEALAELAEFNRTEARRNLRTTLVVAHEALVNAVGRAAERIDPRDVEQGALRQGNG